MLSEEAIYKLSERLVQRANDLNMYMLLKLARQIKEIGEMTPSQLREVFQSIKYGNDISEIARKLAEYTELNEKDIFEIFEETARKSQYNAKKFYEYRNIAFIPYEQNRELKQLVKALATQTNDLFLNMSKTSAFGIAQDNGGIIYSKLSDVYQRVTDDAIFNALQGRETYETNIKNAVKTLSKGIQVVDFASGYHRRLDSQVRMNISDGIRQVENTLQEQFGKEFMSDGVEITHHEHPAPDHSSNIVGGHDMDGHQFALIDKIQELQAMGYDKDIEINGNKAILKGKTYEDYSSINITLKRPISAYNCYHNVIQIILGVTSTTYTEKQLQESKERNEKGFEFEGNHYTLYEGTQLQRKIETAIRKNKEQARFYETKGDMEESLKYQLKVKRLSNKYNRLSKASGLERKMERLKIY